MSDGKKYRLSPEIVDLRAPNCCYIWPYCGGAVVLFAKSKEQSTNHREVLNDKNLALVTFYKIACDHPKEFHRQLQNVPYSRFFYNESVDIVRNPQNYDEIEIAIAVFVAFNQSFNNSPGKGEAMAR